MKLVRLGPKLVQDLSTLVNHWWIICVNECLDVFNAFFNLLLDSDSIKAFLAVCNAVRCDAVSIDFVMTSSAGKMFPIKFGQLRFWPRTSCAGLYSLLLNKDFLAETAHAKAVSKSHLISSFISNKIVYRVWLSRLQTLLLQGLNAVFVCILILNRSQISWKLSLL